MNDARHDVRRILGPFRPSSSRALILAAASLLSSLVLTLGAIAELELTPAAARMFFILAFAALLWLTEAIPAFAVGILVIALEILLLGRPGGVYASSPRDWESFVVILGHPLIWLFFGGFVLAAGVTKTRLDRRIAGRILERFGASESSLLAGIMGIAFVFSMFMSNTATAAMMVAMMRPMLEGPGSGSGGVSRARLLGVAFAASLGGMATLIGSPPNAIAAGVLSELPGQSINFLQWTLLGLPPALALLGLAWSYLFLRYGWRGRGEVAAPAAPTVEPQGHRGEPWHGPFTLAVTLATIALWMTGQWHGLPTAVVSFVPITLLTMTSVLAVEDVRALPWDILLLLAGGLALGEGVQRTGLAEAIVSTLPVANLGVVPAVLLMAWTALALSNVMSNTAATNVLMPIAVALVAGHEARMAVPLALSASCAMCLPISTPPNAIVYSTGRIETHDLLAGGLLLGLAAPFLSVGWNELAIDWVLSLH